MHTFTTHFLIGLKISALVLPPTTLALLLIALFSPSTLPQWLSIGSATVDIRVLYALAQLVTLSVAMITAKRKARTMMLAVSSLLLLLALPTDVLTAIAVPAALLPTLYVARSLSTLQR